MRPKQKSCVSSSCAHGSNRGGGAGVEIESVNVEAPMNIADLPDDISHYKVHEIKHTDLRDRSDVRRGEAFIAQKANQYVIDCTDEVDTQVRSMQGPAVALSTSAKDNACAIHSVFGAPSSNGELTAPNGRQFACRLMQIAPDVATEHPLIARMLQSLQRNFWEEFALRHFEGQSSREGELFWASLVRIFPAVAEDAGNKYQRHVDRLDNVNRAKQHAVAQSKNLFYPVFEPLVREVATSIGYLPQTGSPPSQVKYEGLESVCGDDGFVRGMKRVRVANALGMSKYDALFDANPVFDNLREAFLVYGDAHSSPRSFRSCLEEIQQTGRHNASCDSLKVVVQALRNWIDASDVDDSPPLSFTSNAWTAYLECIRSNAYFFSTSELALMCRIAKVNVRIFKQIETTFTYVDGHCDEVGPSVLVKLLSSDVGEAHSHFERVLCGQDLLELDAERGLALSLSANDDENILSLDFESKDEVPPPPQPLATPPLRKRIRGKTTVDAQGSKLVLSDTNVSKQPFHNDSSQLASDDFYSVRCMPCEQSPDPRVQLEMALMNLASLIREHPTLPADESDDSLPSRSCFDDSKAPSIPPKHCAFKGCRWQLDWSAPGERPVSERRREMALVEHVQKAHFVAIALAVSLLPSMHSALERTAAVYNEALAIRSREAAPIASYAIDRKCLRKAAEVLADDNIQNLICFFCGCIHPYLDTDEREAQHIVWMKPCNESNSFLKYSRKETEYHFSLEAYLNKYAVDPLGHYDLRRHVDEFDDWIADIPFGNDHVKIICCPEDRRCNVVSCRTSLRLCKDCEVPVCKLCRPYFTGRTRECPPGALANDMMIFSPPREIYVEGGLTVMEMICASACLTSMICFSMEVKYGNMLDTTLLMQRHRVGARGNATTFLLPCENVLAEMQKLDEEAAQQEQRQDLPRSGDQLKYAVQVLLKTSDEDQRDSLKHFIHQAHVRQHRIIEVIMAMKRIGHRAYVNVDEAAVRRNAAHLPEYGIPPELISLLPNDNGFDKLRMQKAATPVEGMKKCLTEAADRFKEDRPNAVVLERSTAEEGDVKLRQAAALKRLDEMLDRQATFKEQHTEDDPSALSQEQLEVTLRDNVKNAVLQYAITYLEHTDMLQFLNTAHAAGRVFSHKEKPAKH